MNAQNGSFVVVILAGRFGLRFLFDTMVKLAHEAVFVYTKLKFRIASVTPGPLLDLFFKISTPLCSVMLDFNENGERSSTQIVRRHGSNNNSDRFRFGQTQNSHRKCDL